MLDERRLAELADSYLDHIIIIAKVRNKGANLRDFLDPWWSLRRGGPFVKDNDNPSQHTLNNPCACGCEHAIRLSALDWISVEARAALDRGVCKYRMKVGGVDTRDPSDRLIVDHSVPLMELGKLIFAKEEWTRQELRDLLDHHFKRGLLTKAEDRRLDEKVDGQSLQCDMPAGWEKNGDPFARYHARGIRRWETAAA